MGKRVAKVTLFSYLASMKARELYNILGRLTDEELELDVQMVASGTINSPVYDDIGVQVDKDEFDPTRKVLRFEID